MVAQLEDMVADGQVVLQPERLQDHPVPHGEGQPKVIARVTYRTGEVGGGGGGEGTDTPIPHDRLSPSSVALKI